MLSVSVSPHDDEGESGEVRAEHHEGHHGLGGDHAGAVLCDGDPLMPRRLFLIRLVSFYHKVHNHHLITFHRRPQSDVPLQGLQM